MKDVLRFMLTASCHRFRIQDSGTSDKTQEGREGAIDSSHRGIIQMSEDGTDFGQRQRAALISHYLGLRPQRVLRRRRDRYARHLFRKNFAGQWQKRN